MAGYPISQLVYPNVIHILHPKGQPSNWETMHTELYIFVWLAVLRQLGSSFPKVAGNTRSNIIVILIISDTVKLVLYSCAISPPISATSKATICFIKLSVEYQGLAAVNKRMGMLR